MSDNNQKQQFIAINTVHIITSTRTPSARISSTKSRNEVYTLSDPLKKNLMEQTLKSSIIILPQHQKVNHLFEVRDSRGRRVHGNRDIRAKLIQHGAIVLPANSVLFCTVGRYVLYFLHRYNENQHNDKSHGFYLDFSTTENNHETDPIILHQLQNAEARSRVA